MLLRRIVGPVALGVCDHLRPVEDGCAQHRTLRLQHIQLLPVQSRLGGLPDGVDVPEPADGLPPLLLCVVNAVVNARHRVQVPGLRRTNEIVRHILSPSVLFRSRDEQNASFAHPYICNISCSALSGLSMLIFTAIGDGGNIFRPIAVL